MADRDVELLDEQDIESQEDQVKDGEVHGSQADEPHTEPVTRADLLDAALAEGVEEATLADLADKSEITLDDLKKLPGADELTDEQLVAQWNAALAEAQKSAGGAASPEATEVVDAIASKSDVTLADLKTIPGTDGMTDEQIASLWQRAQAEVNPPFPMYDRQGNKVDADKVNLFDLISGNVQIGYQALGKEQRKALADVIRNASLGHWNEQKYNTTVAERNQVAQKFAELEAQSKQFESERGVWHAALQALAMGNQAPMKAILDAFQKAASSAPAAPGMMTIEQVRQEQAQQAAGFEAIQNYIMPRAMELAQAYGAKIEEVTGAIRWFIEQEPPQFFTKEKLDSIIAYEVPAVFEGKGYRRGGQVQTGQSQTINQPNQDVAELKATVAALQSQIAGSRNASTQAARDKLKKAPPAGGGATPGAGDGMPNFKNRSQMKAYFANDPDWQKA